MLLNASHTIIPCMKSSVAAVLTCSLSECTCQCDCGETGAGREGCLLNRCDDGRLSDQCIYRLQLTFRADQYSSHLINNFSTHVRMNI